MIFGTGLPKISYSGVSETVVLLDHAVEVELTPQPAVIENESVVNGHRAFTEIGIHWVYRVKVNLHKYANPTSKYTEIAALLHEDVTLWRHRDDNAFTDSSGNIVLFYFRELHTYYYDEPAHKDYCILTLESTQADIDMSNFESYPVDDLGNLAADDTGTTLGIQ